MRLYSEKVIWSGLTSSIGTSMAGICGRLGLVISVSYMDIQVRIISMLTRTFSLVTTSPRIRAFCVYTMTSVDFSSGARGVVIGCVPYVDILLQCRPG